MSSPRAPAIFISHGAPTELIQQGPWQTTMDGIGREVKPRAVIVMSAHWRSQGGFDVGYQPTFETLHDFSGFPEELSKFKYPAKGDLDLAEQCVSLLKGAAYNSSLDRAFDRPEINSALNGTLTSDVRQTVSRALFALQWSTSVSWPAPAAVAPLWPACKCLSTLV